MFCDESSQNLRQYVIGGVYFSPSDPEGGDVVVSRLEQQLTETKDRFALEPGTLKWAKVPSDGQYLEGYKEFLTVFLEEKRFYFKCMVVDRSKYPLDSRAFMQKDPLLGYLKFYCVFLADGFLRRYPEHFFDVRIHQYQDRPGHTVTDLERTVEARFVKRAQPPKRYLDYCRVRSMPLEGSNLLQLTDILVGAVAFVWNDGRERVSKRSNARRELVELIESKRQMKLDQPTSAATLGINIWRFESSKLPQNSISSITGRGMQDLARGDVKL